MSKFWDRFRFRRWGKWLLAGGIGMAVLGTISVEATSRSSFCNNCHIMEPYYESWKHSAHSKIECVQCHIAPGATSFVEAKLNGLGQVVDDVLHRTSPKPSASVSELSCTRSGCHSVETLKKTEINNGRFKFRHDKHLGAKHLGVEISCGTCHSHVKGEDHFQVNDNVCITCHLVKSAGSETDVDGGQATTQILMSVRSGHNADMSGENPPPSSCTTCHDAPKGEIEFKGLKFDHQQFLAFGATCESCHQGVTATPPPIDDGRCLECHTFGVEKSLEPSEMHRIHTLGRHKIECSSCHGAVRHGPKVQTASLEQFECTRCHIDQHAVQRTGYFDLGPKTSGEDPNALSSPMFLAHVDCTGCHTQKRALNVAPGTGASVMAASPESCDNCHQAGFGARMIPLWQRTSRELYAQIDADLKAAQGQGAPAEPLAEARRLLELVRVDGSWGVHNPRRTQQLLEEARTNVASARAPKEKTQ